VPTFPNPDIQMIPFGIVDVPLGGAALFFFSSPPILDTEVASFFSDQNVLIVFRICSLTWPVVCECIRKFLSGGAIGA
jgi:hypothetical protein